ncbi:hypothetical protein HGRIS_009113 [Hohenbuehelia grisea]|uniref:Heterokaryon incompatibility domain-containing protein n=1 Tax=Hohenbuehelia grisea TaxID=104357 RepID=A0ABR3J0I4_9AGAR
MSLSSSLISEDLGKEDAGLQLGADPSEIFSQQHPHSTDLSAAQSLVCDDCWRTVFSIQGFSMMRQIPSNDDLWYKDQGLRYKTNPWTALQQASAHCHFCEMVHSAIVKHDKVQPSTEQVFLVTVGLRLVESIPYSPYPFEILTFVVDDGSVVPDAEDRTVCAPEDSVGTPHIRALALPAPTDTVDNIARILNCIQSCANHELCPRPLPSRLPTRVIDCSEPARPRLVTPSPTLEAFYVNLSYVWGEEQVHRTTSDNTEAYHNVIESHHIPQTIRDAIKLTHRLGVRYLWVDSLCIIQDSAEDKSREIEKMRVYYRNAWLTIVAANAERVSQGFLHPVPKWSEKPVTLPFRSTNGSLGTMQLHRTYADWPKVDDPVDQRAWCLQERVLSPRRLLFCSHALQFECQKVRVNVNGSPLGVPDIYPCLPDAAYTESSASRSQQEELELVDSWDTIVQNFTARELTEEQDKLLAIAGVAKEFHRIWSQSQYMAGLWTHRLPGELLWCVSQRDTKEWTMPSRLEPPKPHRAPSWSWAATDGAIQAFRSIPHTKLESGFCSAKHCEAFLKRATNPYGEVTGGLLVLEATWMSVIWMPKRRLVDNLVSATAADEPLAAGAFSRFGSLEPDSSEFMEQESKAVTIIGIQKSARSVHGLALIPSSESTSYRRIGCVRLRIAYWAPEPPRIFRIV